MPPGAKQTPPKSRIIAPLALLPIVLPSTALAVLYAVGARPWVAPGAPVSSDLANALLVGVPTVVWSGSWLAAWDGDPAFPERRMIICGIACALALVVYVLAAGAYLMWGVGTALN